MYGRTNYKDITLIDFSPSEYLQAAEQLAELVLLVLLLPPPVLPRLPRLVLQFLLEVLLLAKVALHSHLLLLCDSDICHAILEMALVTKQAEILLFTFVVGDGADHLVPREVVV